MEKLSLSLAVVFFSPAFFFLLLLYRKMHKITSHVLKSFKIQLSSVLLLSSDIINQHPTHLPTHMDILATIKCTLASWCVYFFFVECCFSPFYLFLSFPQPHCPFNLPNELLPINQDVSNVLFIIS